MSWFDVPTTQLLIFILFESVGVLFEGAFFLWISLMCPFKKRYIMEMRERGVDSEVFILV